MSVYTTNTATRPLFGSVSATLSTLIEAATQYRMYRKTVTELSKLSSRDLADLGLARSSIKAIAMEAVYGA